MTKNQQKQHTTETDAQRLHILELLDRKSETMPTMFNEILKTWRYLKRRESYNIQYCRFVIQRTVSLGIKIRAKLKLNTYLSHTI